MKQCVLSERYRAHRLSANRDLEDGNFSRYCFLLPSVLYLAGSSVVKEFTFGGIKSKEASKEFEILFIGIKMLMKSLVNHFQSPEFSIGD